MREVGGLVSVKNCEKMQQSFARISAALVQFPRGNDVLLALAGFGMQLQSLLINKKLPSFFA